MGRLLTFEGLLDELEPAGVDAVASGRLGGVQGLIGTMQRIGHDVDQLIRRSLRHGHAHPRLDDPFRHT